VCDSVPMMLCGCSHSAMRYCQPIMFYFSLPNAMHHFRFHSVYTVSSLFPVMWYVTVAANVTTVIRSYHERLKGPCVLATAYKRAAIGEHGFANKVFLASSSPRSKLEFSYVSFVFVHRHKQAHIDSKRFRIIPYKGETLVKNEPNSIPSGVPFRSGQRELLRVTGCAILFPPLSSLTPLQLTRHGLRVGPLCQHVIRDGQPYFCASAHYCKPVAL
jgi:hypothetical protein